MKRFLISLIASSILGTVLTIPLDRAVAQSDVRCRLDYRCRSEQYLGFWDLKKQGGNASTLIVHRLEKCSRSNLAQSLCAVYSTSRDWPYQIKLDYQYIDVVQPQYSAQDLGTPIAIGKKQNLSINPTQSQINLVEHADTLAENSLKLIAMKGLLERQVSQNSPEDLILCQRSIELMNLMDSLL